MPGRQRRRSAETGAWARMITFAVRDPWSAAGVEMRTANREPRTAMAHFDIPLDLPHAGRIADRIVALLEKHAEELELDVPEVIDLAERLSSFLFRSTSSDDNPPNAME